MSVFNWIMQRFSSAKMHEVPSLCKEYNIKISRGGGVRFRFSINFAVIVNPRKPGKNDAAQNVGAIW